jgi:hypothetical protein
LITQVSSLRWHLGVALLSLGCGEAGGNGSALQQALPSTSLVISQVYGAGDTTTPAPPYRTDFVELRNLSSQAVPLGGYTLQHAPVMGSNWLVADFDPAASVPPLGFHLIAFSVGMGTRGAQLPTPDTTNAVLNIGRAEFKLALVSGPLALTGACPLTGPDAMRVVDFVGAGTANCSEGAAAVPASVTTSLHRRGAGCLDTDRNVDDFEALAPVPRNGIVMVGPCLADGGSIAPPDAGAPRDAGAEDGGATAVDAGPSASDAGAPVDAGPGDAGPASLTDAGSTPDAGRTSRDAGSPDAGAAPMLTARSGCRCSGVDPATGLVALAVLALRGGRRRSETGPSLRFRFVQGSRPSISSRSV